MTINEFFAITETSIYHVLAKSKNGNPSVIEIALRDKSLPVSSSKIRNAEMISIGMNIIGYIPKKYGWTTSTTSFERNVSLVNIDFWRGQTSRIVALFETEEEAKKCFNAPNPIACDPRWIEQTRQIIRKIGDNHPIFFVPRDSLALIY